MRTWRVIDEYTCVDELEQALAYASIPGYQTSIPELWDGTPFIVDVSSTFPNAHELLNVVEGEAERIYEALGYEVFVAGEILPLDDLTKSQIQIVHLGIQQLPPEGRIEIRCCYGEGITAVGAAAPWLRLALLENGEFESRYGVIHEVYHVLGFSHPGGVEGVWMSESLMRGAGHDLQGMPLPTASATSDLARLACIYD